MPTPQPLSPLVLAGLRPEDEQLYRVVLRNEGITKQQLGELTVSSATEIDEAVDRFREGGLVTVSGDALHPVPPAEVLSPLAQTRAQELLREFDLVDALRDLIPTLAVEQLASLTSGRADVDVEALGPRDVYALIRDVIAESSGDVLWFRPDQWRLERTADADAILPELLAAGRRSRAIYPAVVLEEAPEVVRRRAERGELIRIAASVPARMVIFGEQAALVPDRWGENTGRRLLVREHFLVAALAALFDGAWERAIAVPGLEGGAEDPQGERRLLLHQLTRGAKDEQIARALGVSLRTVRRRVADIMDELGATSRFQAGVEAVRRGWV